MSKPDWCPQEIWDAACACVPDYVKTTIKEAISRAILSAETRGEEHGAASRRDLVDCLDDMTKHYVELAESSDCGNWDAENELEVIAARKLIAAERYVSADHKTNQGN